VAWLGGLLRAFAAGAGAVLVSSHLLGELQLLADHVVVIGRGRLLADGPLEALIGPDGHGRADALEAAFLRLTSGHVEYAAGDGP
jgi:ABC-2 type transport system ATP-binding protein